MPTFSSDSNTTKRAKRGLKIAVATLSATAIGGLVLTACSNQPDDNTAAKYIPANAESFVTVALSPSVKQKADLLLMSKHLPSDVHAKQAAQVRDNLLTELFKSNKINFATEIKPWLGTEAAFATLPPTDNSNVPIVVGAVQAKDEKKAEATLSSHHVDAKSYRYLKGYIFFVDADQIKDHQGAKALDAVQQVVNGKAKSLQSVDRYKTNIKTLHGEHIVLGWVDLPALAKLAVAAGKAEQVKAAAEQKAEAAREAQFDSQFGSSSTDDSSTDDSSTFGDTSSSETAYRTKTVANSTLSTGSALSGTSSSTDNVSTGDGVTVNSSSSTDTTDDQSSDVPSSDDSSAISGGVLGTYESLLGLASSANGAVDDGLDKLQSSADATGSYSFEIYAGSSSVVFEGVTEHAGKDNGNTTNRALLNSLPKNILGAVDVADFGTDARKLLDNLTTGKDAPYKSVDKDTPQIRELVNALNGEAVAVASGETKTAYGLVAGVSDDAAATKATGDVVNLLVSKYNTISKSFPVAGGTGYDLSVAEDSADAFSSFDTDPTASTAASGTHVYVAVANHRLAITSGSDFTQSLVRSDGDFGGSDNQNQAFGTDAHLTFGSVYLNLDSIVTLAKKDSSAADSDAGQKWLNALKIAGAQTWSDSGHDYSEIRVTFK